MAWRNLAKISNHLSRHLAAMAIMKAGQSQKAKKSREEGVKILCKSSAARQRCEALLAAALPRCFEISVAAGGEMAAKALAARRLRRKRQLVMKLRRRRKAARSSGICGESGEENNGGRNRRYMSENQREMARWLARRCQCAVAWQYLRRRWLGVVWLAGWHKQIKNQHQCG